MIFHHAAQTRTNEKSNVVKKEKQIFHLLNGLLGKRFCKLVSCNFMKPHKKLNASINAQGERKFN